MTTTLLSKLLTALNEGTARRAVLESYAAGTQPLAFLSPEARTAIGSRFSRMSVNVPRLAVAALAERLRIVGFTRDDKPDPQTWHDWTANDLDQFAPVAHREAFTLGESFVIVWAAGDGQPLATVESAHQVAVLRDPATRAVLAAVKRWELPDNTGTAAVTYTPDGITRWRSDAIGATAGFTQDGPAIPNPLGVVPVVPLRNGDRLLGPAASEFDDVIPLTDALNKILHDLMVASEYSGRPRRWATGVELTEEPVMDGDGNPTGETVEVNPYPERNRSMIAEDPAAKFGQLDAADLAGYEAAVRILQGQISAVSTLPPHYLGVHGDQPASADALRASEASLTARAAARQAVFGRAWEQVARLMAAVHTGAPPASFNIRAQWADPATRSVAQEADAAVKLHAADVLDRDETRARLQITN